MYNKQFVIKSEGIEKIKQLIKDNEINIRDFSDYLMKYDKSLKDINGTIIHRTIGKTHTDVIISEWRKEYYNKLKSIKGKEGRLELIFDFEIEKNYGSDIVKDKKLKGEAELLNKYVRMLSNIYSTINTIINDYSGIVNRRDFIKLYDIDQLLLTDIIETKGYILDDYCLENSKLYVKYEREYNSIMKLMKEANGKFNILNIDTVKSMIDILQDKTLDKDKYIIETFNSNISKIKTNY